jgi:hypothetical protein
VVARFDRTCCARARFRGARHKHLITAPAASVLAGSIKQYAEQPTVRLGEGQTTEVLHPGPLPQEMHFSEDVGAVHRADAQAGTEGSGGK